MDLIIRLCMSLPCNGPILSASGFARPFVIIVDVSRVGVGAVLLQEGENEAEHSVTFFSKKPKQAQRKYCVAEQELLAILLALQPFGV